MCAASEPMKSSTTTRKISLKWRKIATPSLTRSAGTWRSGRSRCSSRAAARLEHRERPLRHVPADRVKDGVAIFRHFSEILRVVVDDFIGSEAAHIVAVRRARGGDHMRADMLGELNGEAGDAARPALDEDGLPALELQRILDRAQGREPGERQGGSVDV